MSNFALKTRIAPPTPLETGPQPFPKDLPLLPAANTNVEIEIAETFARKFLRAGFKVASAVARWGNVATVVLECEGDNPQRPTHTPMIDQPPHAAPIAQWLSELEEAARIASEIATLTMQIQLLEAHGLGHLTQQIHLQLETLTAQAATIATADPILGHAIRAQASASASTATSDTAGVNDDEDNTIITALAQHMDLHSEKSIATIETLYHELVTHGDRPAEAQDRITQLYSVLKELSGIRKEDIVQVLAYAPAVLTALRYSGVAKEEAWGILLNHAHNDWPGLIDLLGEYTNFLRPGHSFNLRYIRSACAIRDALDLRGFIFTSEPSTFAILDRFAEMGWSDDDVLQLVQAMADAISTRTMWGFSNDRLYNSHFQLLPPIVDALGGRLPERRAAITTFIAQLTYDTGQWYLEHALEAIGQLAAQGKLAADSQEEILAAGAWEIYIRQAHDEGIQIRNPTGLEMANQFEQHFAYLFAAPFDLEFIKALRRVQSALPNRDRITGNLDHPETFVLWRDMQHLGWQVDPLTQLIADIHQSWLLGSRDILSDNTPTLLKAATTAGALIPQHQKAAVKALENLVRDNYKVPHMIDVLRNVADFAILPAEHPGNVEQHIDRIVQGIAMRDLTIWQEVAHKIGDDRTKQRALVQALRNRALREDLNAARALYNLPIIFMGLEID